MQKILKRMFLIVFIFLQCFHGRYLLGMKSNISSGQMINDLDKKISIDFVEADLKDVLKIFTQQTGVNFVIDKEVSSELVSLFLDKVTVRQALKSIAEVSGVGFYPIAGTSVLRVGLSQDGQKDPRVTKIYRLRYARVSMLSLSTGEDIKKTGDYAGSTGTQSTQASTSIFSSGDKNSTEGIINAVVAVLSEEGILSIDQRTNSLIVTDYPDKLSRIDKIISELDKKTRQVLIKAEIVEVQDSLNNILGMSYGDPSESKNIASLKYIPPNLGGQVFPFDSNLFGFVKNALTQEEGNGVRLNETTFGRLSAGQFRMVLQALKTSGKSRFLARPRVITLDNEPAVVDITSETAINEDTIVDEDTNRQTTMLERTTVGVLLRVTPQINNNEQVTMILQPSITDVAPSRLFPNKAFDPSTRSVLTKIRIKQGDTISIAGLIQKVRRSSGSKIPILGDVPLLGSLFTQKSKEENQTDLLVFITPYILDEEALLHLQKKERGRDVSGRQDFAGPFLQGALNKNMTRPKGRHLMQKKMNNVRMAAVIEECEANVQRNPQDPEAHSNLGVAYAKARKYDLAIDQFKGAIMLDPEASAAYNNLGNLYRIKRNYDAAITALNKAIQIMPKHPYAYTTLGLCYEVKGMYAEARNAYQSALEVAPHSSWSKTSRERLSVIDAQI